MQTLLLLCRLEEAACLAIVPERLKGHAPADWKGRACLGADSRNRLGAGTPPCQEPRKGADSKDGLGAACAFSTLASGSSGLTEPADESSKQSVGVRKCGKLKRASGTWT